MSLWTCPIHGLYGGDVFCPACGGTGAYTTLVTNQASQRLACDSGSDPQGGDPSGAPGEASQSGGATSAASPTP